MRGLHLLFCPAPGGHQPPSGGSPLSPAPPSRPPRCPPASCPGSSPSGPGPGRSSTRWSTSHSAAPTRLPPGVRLLLQGGLAAGGGRSCRRAPPRMEQPAAPDLLAAFGGISGHLALLPARIPSKTATSLSCQSCHSLLGKGRDTPL